MNENAEHIEDGRLSAEELKEHTQRTITLLKAHPWVWYVTYYDATNTWIVVAKPETEDLLNAGPDTRETTEVTQERNDLLRLLRGKHVEVKCGDKVVYQQPAKEPLPKAALAELSDAEIIERLETHEDIQDVVKLNDVWTVRLSELGSSRCLSGLYKALRGDLCKLLGDHFQVQVLKDGAYVYLPLSLDPREPPGRGIADVVTKGPSAQDTLVERLAHRLSDVETQLSELANFFSQQRREHMFEERVMYMTGRLAPTMPEASAEEVVHRATALVDYATRFSPIFLAEGNREAEKENESEEVEQG